VSIALVYSGDTYYGGKSSQMYPKVISEASLKSSFTFVAFCTSNYSTSGHYPKGISIYAIFETACEADDLISRIGEARVPKALFLISPLVLSSI